MKLKKIAYKTLFISALSVSVQAQPINYTIIDNTMPMKTTGAHFLSAGCIKYSCYEDAAQFANLKLWIQPLTNQIDTINFALNSIDASGTIWPDDLNAVYGSNAVFEFGPGREYSVRRYLNGTITTKSNTTSWSQGRVWESIQVGGYSSSMQGLLWAWRSVSSNWTGIWSAVSNYESTNTASLARQNLPNPVNKKHIIIVSDSIDNDGPGEAANPQPAIGLTELPPRIKYTTTEPVKYSVCDAHKPIKSITNAEYYSTCDAIAAQGIKVHVIYTGSVANNRLSECAKRTGGSYNALSSVTDATLATAFANINTKLNATPLTSVKIIPVPAGY